MKTSPTGPTDLEEQNVSEGKVPAESHPFVKGGDGGARPVEVLRVPDKLR